MLQLIAALAVANLVARVDEPPLWMVRPFEGILGKIMCLNNIPLFGQVKDSIEIVNEYFEPFKDGYTFVYEYVLITLIIRYPPFT